MVAFNNAKHREGFFVAPSAPLQSRACWRREQGPVEVSYVRSWKMSLFVGVKLLA